MLKVELYIGDNRLDLFDDETISMNIVTKNLQEIDKVFNDFSQSFTVPASRQNNKALEHWYNADISNGTFNPAIKQAGRIELNKLPFRTGLFQMEKVQVKNTKAYSYTIAFYGDNLNLTELFKEDTLIDLDLDAYLVSYGDFSSGIASTLSSGNVCIPLLLPTSRATAGAPAPNGYDLYHDPRLASEFKPAIKVQRVLDAIETKYGITINSNHFDSSDFAKIFIHAHNQAGASLNWRANWNRLTSTNQTIPDPADYDIGNDEFIIQSGSGNVTFDVALSGIGLEEYTYDLLVYRTTAGPAVYSVTYDIDQPNVQVQVARDASVDFQIFFAIRGTAGADFTWDIIASNGVVIDSGANEDDFSLHSFPFTNYTYTDTLSSETITVEGNLPKMKVKDFLGGLVTMFNMIIVPTSATEFTIEPFDDWMAAGSTVDFADYVDNYEYEIHPASIYGEIHFKYQDTEYRANKQFTAKKRNNYVQYGDLRTQIVDANGDPLSKEEFEIELPLTNVLFRNLRHISDGYRTNILVGELVNQENEQELESAVLVYRVGQQSITSGLFRTKQYESSAHNTYTNYNLCYQFNTDDDSYTGSLNWGTEINPRTINDGTATSPSLYYTYWSDFITDLYDLQNRRYTMKAVLPVGFLVDLQLNNLLRIGTNVYRINSMNVDITTGEATLDLVNEID